eukprot:Polyplicarium_translucidae@DN4651_c0_g1_i1.p2
MRASLRRNIPDSSDMSSLLAGPGWPSLPRCVALHFDCVAAAPEAEKCHGVWSFKFFTTVGGCPRRTNQQVMRTDFARRCDAHWHCHDHCEPRWDHPCPWNWILDPDPGAEPGQCKAGPQDRNTCGLSSAPRLAHALFPQLCHSRPSRFPSGSTSRPTARWSGRATRRITACETGLFVLTADVCAPPPSADEAGGGACEQRRSFDGLSEEERRKWASECNQPWICAEGARGPPEAAYLWRGPKPWSRVRVMKVGRPFKGHEGRRPGRSTRGGVVG